MVSTAKVKFNTKLVEISFSLQEGGAILWMSKELYK